MIALNLPPFEYKLKKADGKLFIFDVIRKKYTYLSPEEWVRQHFVHYIINEMKYPRSLITVEEGLSYNQRLKRSDIVIFNRQGTPWMVIECKAPTVLLSPETLFQASVYNVSLKAQYITITNGMSHLFAQVDYENSRTTWLDNLPVYI
jgi:hypothetical protein